MNKVLILSVRSEHAYNILTGKKTLELRKSVPKGFKGWVYVYCSKSKPLLWNLDDESGKDFFGSMYVLRTKGLVMNDMIYTGFSINGKVVCRFWFDEYYEINKMPFSNNYYLLKTRDYNDVPFNKILDNLHLTHDEVYNYGKGKPLYAWHIKNLDIFDKPMELREFEKEEYAVMPNGIWPCYQPITKAPHPYMYAWVKEEGK